MSNAALRQALRSARMTEDDLAARLDIDPKTVSRWVAGRVPHQQNRWRAAEVLGVNAEMLWPEAVRQTIKTGHDREIISVYPFRSAVPRGLWRDLITSAQKTLTFAGYTNYFLWMDVPNLRNILRRKAEQGASVRFIVGDPDSDVTREREQIESVPLTVSTRIQVTLDELRKLESSGVDARFTDQHIHLSVFMFDDQMIVNTHLADLLGHDSPTLHIKRLQDDGLYDRYASHVAYLWEQGRDLDRPEA